jgi:hypothetical protein
VEPVDEECADGGRRVVDEAAEARRLAGLRVAEEAVVADLSECVSAVCIRDDECPGGASRDGGEYEPDQQSDDHDST